MESTMMDVEYYIDKMKTDNNNIDNSTNLYWQMTLWCKYSHG
jgi:hypothetical protein